MAQPRRDGYGRPLPDLVDARQEHLRERPQNQAQQVFLLQLLEEQLAALLRRGIHAQVKLSFNIQDGVIQGDLDVEVIRHRRQPVERRDDR